MSDTFLIAGGGTGGHIFPALAIGHALEQRVAGASVVFVGTRYGMEKDLVPQRGYALITLPTRGLLGKSPAQKLALLWRLPLSLALSLFYLLRLRPKAVVGVGGYASGPLLLAASLLRIPTLIQEQNAFPGLTNRFCSRFAKLACCGFAEAAQGLHCPVIVTGNPIRSDFGETHPWSAERKTLLILGGSQGARALNRNLPAILKAVLGPERGLRVVHQCGKDHVAEVSRAYENAPFPVEVLPFIEDMSARLQQALLLICRAGASTIAELKRVRIPALLVPFPQAAHDHQTFNAKSLANLGAANLVAESHMEQVAPLLTELLDRPAKLAAMAAAYPTTNPDSAGLCAEIILELQQQRKVKEIVKRYEIHVSQN